MTEYLVFDRSETEDGICSWDALASPDASHSLRLLDETAALLHHLQQLLGPPGPREEGHDWDLDLQVHDTRQQAWPWDWSAWTPPAYGLGQRPPLPDARLTLALNVSVSARGQQAATRLLEGPDGQPGD